ncbi:MAG: permease [Beijerinckiaceae bacterium]|nr:permease [Beijerinckiaceae bacterium]
MGSLAFFGIASLILCVIAWRRSPTLVRGAFRNATLRFFEILPRIGFALLTAGFISQIVPAEVIGNLIGYESGLRGILIGALVGGLTPAGPIVSFPIVLVLMAAGGGFPQVMAYLTAWSVFAFHRVIIYEIPLMGGRFVMIRLAASAILPILCGLIIWGMMEIWPIGR